MPEAPLIFGYLRDHRVANSLQTHKILRMHFPPWGVKTERQAGPNRAGLHHRDVIYLVHNREGLCASDKIRLTSLPLSAMRTQQMSLNLHKAICALERRCVLKRGAINSRVVLNRVETLYMEKAGIGLDDLSTCFGAERHEHAGKLHLVTASQALRVAEETLLLSVQFNAFPDVRKL